MLYVLTMDPSVIIGCAIIVASLTVLAVLVLVSRWRINRIARNGYRSAREVVRELEGDQ